jgi:glycosyltransferase involved in cell wall biosynthesis
MNILFVSYYDPLGQGGFEKQARGLFETLIKDGHRVACLCLTSPEQKSHFQAKLEASKLFSLGVFLIEYQEKPYTLKSKILFWFSCHPAKFLANQSSNLQQKLQLKLKQIYQELNIDIIHCLGLRTSYFLPKQLIYPIIIDLVDCKTQYKQRAVRYYLKNNTTQVFSAFLDFWKTFKIEKNILSLYAKYPVTVVSNCDAKMLKQLHPDASIYTVCHPITIKNSENNAIQIKKRNKLIFYGFMDHVNLDAMLFLIDKIIPFVSKNIANLELAITGFNLPNKIYNLAKKKSWINIIENVNNIPEFIADASLTCWPFRYGSGVKNKIIESMLLGKPVVTTTIGAEAFTEQQKQGFLIADSAEDLAAHIINLLNNPEECYRLGQINQQIVTTEFTWDKKAEDYLNLYKISQKQHLKVNQIPV